MIGLRIGAAELAEIEAGAPCIVLAPGLLRPGADGTRLLPLPGWVRPLALVASDATAGPLRPLLPAGLPVVPDAAALPALLAAALAAAQAERDAAAAERDGLKRALGAGAPLARRVLDLPPGAATATLPAIQPLGRAAEGLCGIALHIAAPGSAGLRVRLLAGARVLGRWRVPAAAMVPGWLDLDLPEPAPPGPPAARRRRGSAWRPGAPPCPHPA